jgi:hypothetical protein
MSLHARELYKFHHYTAEKLYCQHFEQYIYYASKYIVNSNQNQRIYEQRKTFPMDPSPKNADLSKHFVASLSSSKENTRCVGIICVANFTA